MPRRLASAAVSALLAGVVLTWMAGGAVHAQAPAAGLLSGTWTIDRDASEFPREVGFNADFVPSPRPDNAGPQGRGRRGGSGGAMQALRPQGESYDAAQRRQVLTDEVRLPPTRLTIVDTPDSIVVTDQEGHSRTFHPDGRAETLQIGTASVLTTVRREGNAVIVLYAVADLRQIRYTYSREPGSPTLMVDTQFLERGSGDSVRRIYKPADLSPVPTLETRTRGDAAAPVDGASRTTTSRPASEFTGLTRMGVVVEEPSTQAVNCGITRTAIEQAVSKHFTGIGLKVSTNSDEDTYLHVTIMTSAMPNGMCITRYDWSNLLDDRGDPLAPARAGARAGAPRAQGRTDRQPSGHARHRRDPRPGRRSGAGGGVDSRREQVAAYSGLLIAKR
ncbi:MAG: hypothetical protein QM736_00370 [Vicinamibacterales bacterium]